MKSNRKPRLSQLAKRHENVFEILKPDMNYNSKHNQVKKRKIRN